MSLVLIALSYATQRTGQTTAASLKSIYIDTCTNLGGFGPFFVPTVLKPVMSSRVHGRVRVGKRIK